MPVPGMMPRPPWRPEVPLKDGAVAKAMSRAGATNAEANRAQDIASRFGDMKKETKDAGVVSTFSIIRTEVFDRGTADEAMKGEALTRANTILLQAFDDLGGIRNIRAVSAASLKKLGVDNIDQTLFRSAVQTVSRMTGDDVAQKLAAKHGLSITDVTWEDMGRSMGSSMGTNITDFNLAIHLKDAKAGAAAVYRAPILRRENLTDVTADLPASRFKMLVGNAQGKKKLTEVSLDDVLKNPQKYLKDGAKWPKDASGKPLSLYAPQHDAKKVLVSSQAAFLPVPRAGGKVEFTPQAYNYESHFDAKHGPQPECLTLLITREGVSVQILGKKNEKKFGWMGGDYGEPLFLNLNGKRAPLSAERASTSTVDGAGVPSASSIDDSGDLSRVIVVQVPLTPEFKKPRRIMPMYAMRAGLESVGGSSNVETAVIGHGKIQGAFDESMGEGHFKRDTSLPVRATIIHAYATSNGIVTDAEMKKIRAQLDADYSNAKRTGSLPFPNGLNKPVKVS